MSKPPIYIDPAKMRRALDGLNGLFQAASRAVDGVRDVFAPPPGEAENVVQIREVKPPAADAGKK